MNDKKMSEILKRDLARSEKYRGMLGSPHYMESLFLATLYARECLTTGTLSLRNVDNSWKQARRSLHGEQFGKLVLADLPGKDPQLVEKELNETRPAAKCVRDSFKSLWICIRSRTVGADVNSENGGSQMASLMSQLVERFLDSEEYLLAPDQEEGFLGSLISIWREIELSSDMNEILSECVDRQRQLIGSTATGIAWRCSDIHGCARRRRYTEEESALADQQVLRWVRDCAQQVG